MTAANINTAPAARTPAASERDALLRVMAFLPALPQPTAEGRTLLRLFR
ncbi:hypothetical protein [Antarcticirhabdus aurantiaca]|uniref:Uncharacterized protein n=1 Tax=Antarcticirhabdus aurantiaca TaxID=2606717 RepID=A0ACD4NJL4_9HYPH|nr:hypothetical protein [Antarcticirhabdus aurantiaca]WAJ26953.1 hypothetical protein OXU80_19085 [Jeongeuplla avenae]